jgi:hypothetical protein
MLTNRCLCDCQYCYVDKGTQDIPVDLLWAACAAAKDLGVLDVTLGGGEPTLHPCFVECVRSIWANFPFGLSVTSNGTNEESLLAVSDCVSQIRVSIDPFKKALDARRTATIRRLAEQAPVAINLLYVPNTRDWATLVLDTLLEIGIRDVLLIPQHELGVFRLLEADWRAIEDMVRSTPAARFAITGDADDYLDLPSLRTSHENEYLFAHIDMHGNIRRRSWGPILGKATSLLEFVTALRKLHPLVERERNEILD